MMSGEGVRTYRKKPISLERQDQGRQYRDEDRPAKEESRPPGYLSMMPRRFPI